MMLSHYWLFFQQKDLYQFFLQKVKEAVVSLLERIAQTVVLENSVS